MTSNTSGSGRTPSGGSHAWILTEIQHMMHGFGDCRHPLPDSVKMMHEILRQQMNQLLARTCRIAQSRSSSSIGLEDILLLMTKDRVKLSRLINYLCLKDLKSSVAAQSASGGGDTLLQSSTKELVVTSDEEQSRGWKPCNKSKNKLRKLCEDFLSTIDQTGELMALIEAPVEDDVKMERNLRVDRQSRHMDTDEYLEFSDSRRATFRRKYRVNKFREWLMEDNVAELEPNALALDIFSYLAYETVAQVVDLALLVKQDADPCKAEAAFRGSATTAFNQDYPLIRAAGCQEPPTTAASSPSQHASATATTGTTAKSKKSKLSGARTDFEMGQHQAIQPLEIQEAVRRYYQQAGPMAPLAKVGTSQLRRQLLCC